MEFGKMLYLCNRNESNPIFLQYCNYMIIKHLAIGGGNFTPSSLGSKVNKKKRHNPLKVRLLSLFFASLLLQLCVVVASCTDEDPVPESPKMTRADSIAQGLILVLSADDEWDSIANINLNDSVVISVGGTDGETSDSTDYNWGE